MKNLFNLSMVALLVFGCSVKTDTTSYLNLEETGVKSGGIKMIPIHDGKFKVWTKRVGNNPTIKVLLLHGGPSATHEYFESFDSFFPQAGIEYYYYDQLGSYYSDQPTDSSLWTIERFVEEVEEVRQALKLNSSNFYLLGNSWGGILAMEYALKYQQNLKGLIICNMMASCPEYGQYADQVLAPQMDPKVLEEIRAIEAKKDFKNPRYAELLIPNFYEKHICRMPLADWPEPVQRSLLRHLNSDVYTLMQGPSEFGISGRLEKWDVKSRLPEITVPTLTVGATHDTMDPKHMEWMSTQVKRGRFLLCPNGGHLSMWDDQEHFFPGVIQFINDVDRGTF